MKSFLEILRKPFLVSTALSVVSGLAVALVWWAGALDSLGAIFVMSRGAALDAGRPVQPQVLVAVLMIIAASIGGGFIVLRLGAGRAFRLMAVALVLLCVVSFMLSRTLAIDILFAPLAFAAIIAAFMVQAWRLWRLDATLTRNLTRDAVHTSALEGDAANARLMSGVRLLNTMLALDDAIVFRCDEEGALVPAARLRATEATGAAANGHKQNGVAEVGRNSAWRDGVRLCERAVQTSEMQTMGKDAVDSRTKTVMPDSATHPTAYAASVAFPLEHAGHNVGALLVRLREDFNEDDRPLLAAVGSQLARDLQRDETRRNTIGRSAISRSTTLVSIKAARHRLESCNVISGLLAEQSFAPFVLDAATDGYAVIYLDGTIGYINPRMLHYAQIAEKEQEKLDLFSLLDRFRGGVFDEPELAVRRVLQTSDSYERELYFADRNQTLALRISLITQNSNNGAPKTARQPLCLAVTVSDVSRAREHDKLRSDMVSLMSHELRTPITSINGFAELLSIDETLPLEAREYVTTICNESQRLSRMINTFLAVTKLEQGDRQEVMQMPLLLDDVVRDTVANLQTAAKRKRIRLVAHCSGVLPPVIADRGLITEAVTNLIDNAIRYSPERTTVTVSTELETEAVRVVVEDRGYGIPPESIDRVWEKFYRVARDGQEKDEESTGLGLAFVREVVEQHNGAVSLESEVGRGSKFSFTLPRL